MAEQDNPADRHDQDSRPDIEQAVESRSDEADAAGGGDAESVGSEDGPNGAGGVVKNQDELQQ